MTQSFVFPPACDLTAVPVIGNAGFFPVRRVFCAGRNYAAHAREMGWTGERENPFFFMKPNDAIVAAPRVDAEITIPYPPMTGNLHHEIELVVALQSGGKNISAGAADACVFGYALGLDLTRRDLQNDFKKNGHPWDMAKGFDCSAPLSPIIPKSAIPNIADCVIELQVGGTVRQHGKISDMIWSIPEIISNLSGYVELKPGDLIFTGSPEGVAAIKTGDVLKCDLYGAANEKMPHNLHLNVKIG